MIKLNNSTYYAGDYTIKHKYNGKNQDEWSCDCPGYTFRKDCSHVKEAKTFE